MGPLSQKSALAIEQLRERTCERVLSFCPRGQEEGGCILDCPLG